jgi:small redox-active disulfide protein 2
MTTVKVLGAGCAKCTLLHQRLLELKTANRFEFDLVKITDLREIISYGIMATPGLIINGVVKSVGAVPKDSQLMQWLKEASNAS